MDIIYRKSYLIRINTTIPRSSSARALIMKINHGNLMGSLGFDARKEIRVG
jgi:hypothetical protein